MRKWWLFFSVFIIAFSSCDYENDEYYDKDPEVKIKISKLSIDKEVVSTIEGQDQCSTLWSASVVNDYSNKINGRINATILYQGNYIVIFSKVLTVEANQTLEITTEDGEGASSIIPCEALHNEITLFNVQFIPE